MAHGGGWHKYGYQDKKGEDGKYPIDIKEANVIRFIALSILTGNSLKDIKGYIGKAGITTNRGKAINAGWIKNVLTNERIYGNEEYADIIFKGAYEHLRLLIPNIAKTKSCNRNIMVGIRTGEKKGIQFCDFTTIEDLYNMFIVPYL